MLVTEMIQEIRDHGFDDIDEARVLSFINDAYQNIWSREAWPFLEATSTLTVDTTGKVTAPTDIGKILTIEDTTFGRRLQPVRLDWFTRAYGNRLSQTGDAYLYYFLGSSVYVYPIPTSPTLTARYIRIPPTLTSSPDTTPLLPFQHHDIIVLGALARCYFMEDDPENKTLAENDFEQRIGQMRDDLWMRQYDRTDTIQDLDGYDEVDWLY
jgi:hypothetical protein